ncbi:putative triacylglycerol lipase fgl2 [Diaporthe ampelina]|uniref:Putative triacylglycerol lipase fgl2 n=1 Tax=Diaporthe ampelina TaxID=1214573 RepID=A0A0G2IAR2_9PEZI|nr:putative triacylglycerol lipase fgl2 [Diaporthe ampelina]
MRLLSSLIPLFALDPASLTGSSAKPHPGPQQRPISSPSSEDGYPRANSVSTALFASLERLARLVDITYCVGTTGISPPFSCASRCKEFPDLRLASTWNTGVLMSDSCGYVAVDHGSGPKQHGAGAGAGGAGEEEGAIVMAFRGTYSITNTVVDLSTVPQEYVPYPEPDDGRGDETANKCHNCTVHMGFLESWTQARKLVLPVLKNVRARHRDYPIHLVGHSLGGAVALLAALELKVALGWDDLVVTTFGEPQAGNAGFVDYVDRIFGLDGLDGHDPDLERRAYRRVTHAGDPVPLLPLSEWGYRPHAGEVFITKPELSPAVEDLRLCRGDEDPACIAGADSAMLARMAEALDEVPRAEVQGEGWLDMLSGVPSRLKLWQLLFAHRDYFWRLGLCVPGGDPSDWGRPPYNVSSHPDEL